MNDTIRLPWTTLQKIVFRFFAAYLSIYLLYSVGIFSSMSFLWDPLVAVAGRILGLQYQYIAETGSGDTTYDYLLLFCFLWLSLFICIGWSVVDRKRVSYNKAHYWLRVCIRYSLGTIMIGYGSAKIFYSQFSAPDAIDLVKPFGEMSPMGLAWRFMGYSYAFNLYTGLAEALGGFLLFFRRSTTFGSLFSMTVLSTVVAMNFCYDIPVKLFSCNLMLMAIFLAAPDAKRLMTFFFTNKVVAPPTSIPVVFGKKMNYVRVALKTLVIGAFLIFTAREGYSDMYEYGPYAPRSSFNGIYNVQYFLRNNDTIPPLMSDTTRWQQLIVNEDYAVVKYTGDRKMGLEFRPDTTKKKIYFISYQNEDPTIAFYTQPLKDEMRVSWQMDGDTMQVLLKKKDIREYLLVNRGFHWINEYPFNR